MSCEDYEPSLMDLMSRVCLLALDFDGTLTDGYVYTDQSGKETVRCSRKDGLGIRRLKDAGIAVVVISTESNPVVRARCQKLGIDCYSDAGLGQGKLEILRRYAGTRGIMPSEIAYVGDDINDLNCIEYAGIGVTVADGHPKCKNAAKFVTQSRGGEHAVREVCDLILAAKEVS